MLANSTPGLPAPPPGKPPTPRGMSDREFEAITDGLIADQEKRLEWHDRNPYGGPPPPPLPPSVLGVDLQLATQDPSATRV